MAKWLLTSSKSKLLKTTIDREMLWIAHFLHEETTGAVSTNQDNFFMKILTIFLNYSRTNERDVNGEHKTAVEWYEEWLSSHHRCYFHKKLVAARRPQYHWIFTQIHLRRSKWPALRLVEPGNGQALESGGGNSRRCCYWTASIEFW